MDDISGDGDDARIDGDDGAANRPHRKRGRSAKALSPMLMQGPLSICFLIASKAPHALGKSSARNGEHPRTGDVWPGADSLAAAVLYRWSFHPTADVRELPESIRPWCSRLRRWRNGRRCISGFISYDVVVLACCKEWQRCEFDHGPRAAYRCAALTEWRLKEYDGETSSWMPFDGVMDLWKDSFPDHEFPMTSMMLHPSAVLACIDCPADHIHVVGFSRGRVPAMHKLIKMSPPLAMVRRMVSYDAPAARQDSVRQRAGTQLSAEEFLEYLAASSTCTSLRNMGVAAKAWAKIFERKLGIAIDLPSTGPSYETLRRARLQLDLMAMLTFRHWFRTLVDSGSDSWCLYLHMDASPQWRGRELFAATVDIVRIGDEKPYSRHLLPLVNLGAAFRTVQGKAWALLWMITLVVGPEYNLLRVFLGKVRSITTDLGGEFLVRDLGDTLIPFLHAIKGRVPRDALQQQFLFPVAIASPGWHHIFDGLLRFGLCMLDWFPQWLELVKALAKWLRQASDDVARVLDSAGMTGAGALARAVKPPNFAKWRWKTLERVLRSLKSCLEALRMHSHLLTPLLNNSKDKVWAANVRRGLLDEHFMGKFYYVDFFTTWICGMERWGSGCPCEEHRGLKDVKCDKRGRLMHVAYAYAMDGFQDGIREAHGWGWNAWHMDAAALQQAQGAVRATVVRGQEKLRFLDRLPYVLASIETPEHARRTLEQFAEAPREQHHRLTLLFLDVGSQIRQDIVALSEGGAMTARLQREIMWLRQVPLDDSVAEAPHSQARRHELHSRGARFGWHAATQRLKQNLADIQTMTPAVPFTIQYLWDEAKTVPNMAAPWAKKRIHRKTLEKVIYHLSCLPMAEAAGECADVHDDEGDAGRPAGAVVVRGRSEKRSAAEEATHLLREWLIASVKTGMVISVQTPSEDQPVVALQVLELPRKLITVQSYDHDDKKMSLLWSLQKYEMWRGAELPPEPVKLDAFVLEAPGRVDILDYVGKLFAGREKCRVWSPTISDLEGCVAFENPQRLRPAQAVSSDTVPLLALMDEAERQGFVGMARLVEHTPAAPKVFDNRTPSRPYMQAVLASNWLYENGCAVFRSRKTNGYYKLLLKDPAADIAKLSGAEIAARLKSLEDQPVHIAALDVVPALGAPAVLALDDHDEAIEGDVAIADVDPLPLEDAPALIEHEDADEGAVVWPTHVCGVKLQQENRVTAGGVYTEGFRVICPRHGAACKKYRARHLRVAQDGIFASIYFLGAWIKGAADYDAESHQPWSPAVADIHSFMLSDDCP